MDLDQMSALIAGNEMENIPDVRAFEPLKEWLDNMTSAYEIYHTNTSDVDCLRMINDVSQKMKQARTLFKKTQLAACQFALLSNRRNMIGKKVYNIDSPSEESLRWNSSWNQLQVYEGMRSMYAKYLRKVSIDMVDCCLKLDNLHESFLELILDEDCL